MNFESIKNEAEELMEKKRIAKLEKGENFFFKFGEQDTDHMLDGRKAENKIYDTKLNPYSNVRVRLMRQMNMVPKIKKLAISVQSQSVLSKESKISSQADPSSTQNN